MQSLRHKSKPQRQGGSYEVSSVCVFWIKIHKKTAISIRNRKITAGLTQEIFTLLFETAEIANFTLKEKNKYEFNMTTERDRINQMEYALEEMRKNSLAEGIAQAKADNARKMLEIGLDKALIADITGLSPEEIEALEK